MRASTTEIQQEIADIQAELQVGRAPGDDRVYIVRQILAGIGGLGFVHLPPNI